MISKYVSSVIKYSYDLTSQKLYEPNPCPNNNINDQKIIRCIHKIS